MNQLETKTRQSIFLRRWHSISRNRAAMEKLILELMENPATDPQHMAQAHQMYVGVCLSMAEISHHVDNILRTGRTTTDAKFVLARTEKCSCGHEMKVVVGEPGRCPACGMN